MSDDTPAERPVDPDPDERDRHAYEDAWYRALKAVSEREYRDRPRPDENAQPDDA